MLDVTLKQQKLSSLEHEGDECALKTRCNTQLCIAALPSSRAQPFIQVILATPLCAEEEHAEKHQHSQQLSSGLAQQEEDTAHSQIFLMVLTAFVFTEKKTNTPPVHVAHRLLLHWSTDAFRVKKSGRMGLMQ